MDHSLGQIILRHFENTKQVLANVFSDHKDMKVEIINKRKTENFTNMWKLNKTLQNNQQVEENKKDTLKQRWKHNISKTYETQKNQY